MIACRSNVPGRGSILFLSFLGVSALLFPSNVTGRDWVYFDACGIADIETGHWGQEGAVHYVPAPNMKGYLVNSKAVTLIAEAKKKKGLDCVAMVGIGGNTITVIGTLEEVRRKLKDAE